MGGAHFAQSGSEGARPSSGSRWSVLLACVVVVLVVALNAALRYPTEEVRYLNEDATWHTLLTVQAYEETPASQHLFLPIDTLGEPADKYIPWGAAIPDDAGNYYYTSFSPAGFFVAWAFIKAFGLPVAESSIYLLGTVTLAVSACVLAALLAAVYEGRRHRAALVLAGALAYVCLPEVLHGMGPVFWHQSVMQVTLPLQVLAWWHAERGSRGWRVAFWALALANPYIEWTGYVANVGFALAGLIWRRDGWRAGLVHAAGLALVTVCSFGLFCAHYLLRVSATAFFDALLARFVSRGPTSTSTSYATLLARYGTSFALLWALLAGALVWAVVARRGRPRLAPGVPAMLFVLAFPVLENLVMKQHAVNYGYDRIKLALPVLLLTCELARNALEARPRRREGVPAAAGFVAAVAVASALNVCSYVMGGTYVWPEAYRADNEKIASAVTADYPDALYACDSFVRGYLNLLFGRGIYEYQSPESSRALADQRGYDTVVLIESPDSPYVRDVRVFSPEHPSGVTYSLDDAGNLVVTE